MKAIIQFDDLSERLQTIEDLLRSVQPNEKDKWITNDQFCVFLDISHKTAQSYRDRGLVVFSQVGNKIHYRISEVNRFLDDHAKGGFRSGKKK